MSTCEPAEELPPRTRSDDVWLVSRYLAQDESGPHPFDLTTGTPLISGVTSAERTQNHEQIKSDT